MCFFFFNDTATTEIYTLSLHDALPISGQIILAGFPSAWCAGLGVLVTHAFGAAGAPFFGYVHDATGSYDSSFVAFVIALGLSALLSLVARAPPKYPRADQLTTV